MLQSIDSLFTKVSGPLSEVFGPNAKIITVEVHGESVHGLVLCPGKVIRYVFEVNTRDLKTHDLLTLTS